MYPLGQGHMAEPKDISTFHTPLVLGPGPLSKTSLNLPSPARRYQVPSGKTMWLSFLVFHECLRYRRDLPTLPVHQNFKKKPPNTSYSVKDSFTNYEK